MVYQRSRWNLPLLRSRSRPQNCKGSARFRAQRHRPESFSLPATRGQIDPFPRLDPDAAIPARQTTIHYFDSVNKKLGAKTSAEFLRLYMVPGMGHCGGGAGVASWPNGWVPPDADRHPQHRRHARSLGRARDCPGRNHSHEIQGQQTRRAGGTHPSRLPVAPDREI